jgi:hypothetical protein
MAEIIKYKHWKTGEEEQCDLSHYIDVAYKTNLICPFDNTPIIERSYYHNEHDTFCPNCGNSYPRTINQKEINQQAKDSILRNKKDLNELEEKKADLESRIKHAEEVGLI